MGRARGRVPHICPPSAPRHTANMEAQEPFLPRQTFPRSITCPRRPGPLRSSRAWKQAAQHGFSRDPGDRRSRVCTNPGLKTPGAQHRWAKPASGGNVHTLTWLLSASGALAVAECTSRMLSETPGEQPSSLRGQRSGGISSEVTDSRAPTGPVHTAAGPRPRAPTAFASISPSPTHSASGSSGQHMSPSPKAVRREGRVHPSNVRKNRHLARSAPRALLRDLAPRLHEQPTLRLLSQTAGGLSPLPPPRERRGGQSRGGGLPGGAGQQTGSSELPQAPWSRRRGGLWSD